MTDPKLLSFPKAKTILDQVLESPSGSPLPSPSPKLIAACENLLAEAKSGRLQGIAFALSLYDEEFQTSFVIGWDMTKGHSTSLGAGISVLQHRYVQKISAECADDQS